MKNTFTLHAKKGIKGLSLLCLLILLPLTAHSASKYDNPDTIVVSRDGTGEFRNISEAIEVCRAFMEYHKVIYVKKGTYKEKIIIPQWLTNIEICGEDRDYHHVGRPRQHSRSDGPCLMAR